MGCDQEEHIDAMTIASFCDAFYENVREDEQFMLNVPRTLLYTHTSCTTYESPSRCCLASLSKKKAILIHPQHSAITDAVSFAVNPNTFV
jgi:hypothetical protein